MYRTRQMTTLAVFALALCLTLAVGVGAVSAKKATPKLFKNTTYKPLGCGGEEDPCVKAKTTSVKNKLSLPTFRAPPLAFDFVQGSDVCPDQNHGETTIGKHSAVQFDKSGKFSFQEVVVQPGESMTGSGVKTSVPVTWKVTGRIITKYSIAVEVKYVSSGPCTASRLPTPRPLHYASHGEK
jgi:hypothetical protein